MMFIWSPCRCNIAFPFPFQSLQQSLASVSILLHRPGLAMVVHWSGRQRMLSRLERLRPASASCDWQPDGTEAGWSQCQTSRKTTHQREMRKGEMPAVCVRACAYVCVWKNGRDSTPALTLMLTWKERIDKNWLWQMKDWCFYWWMDKWTDMKSALTHPHSSGGHTRVSICVE